MSLASTFEHQMLALINAERAALGLGALTLNILLNDASEDHTNWMLENDDFSHTGENGTSAHDRIVASGYPLEVSWATGENIALQSERGAAGIADDVIQLHEALMNSEGHRANILNPDYTEIGIGIEVGDYDGFEAVAVTQNFGTTGADTSAFLDDGTLTEDTGIIVGTSSNDTIIASGDGAEITAKAGNDVATGTSGQDIILGGNGDDALFGYEGVDTIKGGNGDDRVFGGDGNDTLSGKRGDDELFGGNGNDLLKGNADNDTLSGGSGNDRLVGGAGADVFIFTEGKDRITDFNVLEDKLGFDEDLIPEGQNLETFIAGISTVKNGNLVIDFGGDNSLKLLNVTDLSDVDLIA